MDIGKYVGLFLLKNEYCYLPGIGSLQVVKRTASFNKETLQTETPGYEVVFVKGGGSLDDSFANFIANNERISIAHAANHIREFCTLLKEEFKNGNEILIPGVGKFVSKTGGDEVYFETDPDIRVQEKKIPFFKNSSGLGDTKKEESLSKIIEKTTFKEPKSDEDIVIQPAKVNWGKLGIVIAIVVIVLAIIAFIIFNMNQNKVGNDTADVSTEPEIAYLEEDIVEEPAQLSDSTSGDSTVAPGNDVTPALTDGTVNIIINSYTSQEKAAKRKSQLESFGYTNMELAEKGSDSVRFHVVIKAVTTQEHLQQTIDSLKKLLNPNGNVRVL